MPENDRGEYEPVAESIRLYDTSGGYLVFRVRMEYEPEIDQWFPIQHHLIGVAHVHDPEAIDDVLREYEVQVRVRNLPEFSLQELR